MTRALLANGGIAIRFILTIVRSEVITKFRLYSRANGVFYCEDIATGKQESLHTRDRDEAERLFHTKNEAHRQPTLNLQMAQMYLSACDPASAARTWQDVMGACGQLAGVV